MAFLCLFDDTFKGTQMQIITGVRVLLAKDLIARMKDLFKARLGIIFPYNELTLILNNVRIMAYPAHTVSARGQPNVTFILVDEADFWPKNQQRHIKDVIQGTMTKSRPYVSLVSTAGEPGGIMEVIMNQPEDQCMYNRVVHNVYVGEGRIYTKEDIEFAKLDEITFDREFLCHFGYGIGTIFPPEVIEMVKKYGISFRPPNPNNLKGEELQQLYLSSVREDTQKPMAVDPGFSATGSGSAIVISEHLPETGMIRIIYGKRRMKLSYAEIFDWIWDLIEKVDPYPIYVDSAHPALIKQLKNSLNEESDPPKVQELIEYCKQQNLPLSMKMRVIPVVTTYHTREHLSHAKGITETEGLMAIDPEAFRDLIVDIQTARANEEGKLVKSPEDPKDLFDAYQYQLKYYQFEND
jgi:hypothetical protein